MGKIETKIQNDIVKYLNEHKIWNFRYQAVVNQFGIPDIIAIYKGYFVGLEVKTETGRATELQKKTLASIRNAGGYGAFVTSIEDVENLLKQIKFECI